MIKIKKLNTNAFAFLEWFLLALEYHLMLYAGEKRWLADLPGMDEYKMAWFGLFLRMEIIVGGLSAVGIDFVGKSSLRQIRVASTYTGLCPDLCLMMCRKVAAPLPKVKQTKLYTAGSSNAANEAIPTPVMHHGTPTSAPRIVRSCSSSCNLPCVGCMALRKRKKLLQQQICRLKAKVKVQNIHKQRYVLFL